MKSHSPVPKDSRLVMRGTLLVLLAASGASLASLPSGAGGVAPQGGSNSLYSQSVLADQPRGYWRFGEPDGAASALDASGNGHTAVYANVAPGVDIDGVVLDDSDTAANFPSTIDLPRTDEAQIGRPADLTFTSAFTVEAWVRTAVAAGAIAGDSVGVSTEPANWVVFVGGDGRIHTSLHDTTGIRDGTGPTLRVDDEDWHHVVAVFSPGSGTKIYVDRIGSGISDTVRPSNPPDPLFPDDTDGITIGDTAGYPNFVGDMDEIAMYPSALTDQRIRAHYIAATGPPIPYADEVSASNYAAWWRLGDASTSAMALDESDGAYTGTYRNVTPGVPGAIAGDVNTAAHFPGTTPTDDVLIGNVDDLNFDVNDFSVSAWLKTTSAASLERVVMSKGGLTGPGWVVSVTGDVGQAGRLRAVVSDGSNRTTAYGPSTLVADGAWHYVVVTVEHAGTVRIFVDDQEAVTTGPVLGDVSNTTPMRIGGADGYLSFSGDLDEVALYTDAIEHDTVAAQVDASFGAQPLPSSDGIVDLEDTGPWSALPETFTPIVNVDDPEAGGGTPWDDVGEAPLGPGGPGSSGPGQTWPTLPVSCDDAPNQRVCVSSSPQANYVTFRNDKAWWTIYKECYGPSKRPPTPLADHWRTVGPGYISRVRRRDGFVMVDDERGVEYYNPDPEPPNYYHPFGPPPYEPIEWGQSSALNGYLRGGLGAFGWHHARGPQTRDNHEFNENNSMSIDGTTCAEDTGRPPPGLRGFGVSSSSVSQPVIYSVTIAATRATVPVAVFRADVSFTDGWVPGIVRVRYLYFVYPRIVKVWSIASICYLGCHLPSNVDNPKRYAFIKEPKFAVSAVRRAGVTTAKVEFPRIAVFDPASRIPRSKLRTKSWCADRSDGGRVAVLDTTVQCDNDRRIRVRFDFGTTPEPPGPQPPPDGLCDQAGKKCLNAAVYSYPVRQPGSLNPSVATGPLSHPGRLARPWEHFGLDRFARRSRLRPKFNPTDYQNPEGKLCSFSPADSARSWAGIERWELIGGNKDGAIKANPYHAAGVLLHGWEGGAGFNDCEHLSVMFPFRRRHQPKREAYAMYAMYSFGPSWNIPYR